MAGLRAAHKEMTRRLLLSTALELFQSKGYAATTVDDIALAAGTTRVTFYAYFPSRTDLMRALVGELHTTLAGTTPGAATLVAVVRGGKPAEIEQWLRTAAGRWDLIRPYTVAAFEAAVVDPELRRIVEAWLDEAIGDIERGLTEAGRFDPASRHLRGVLAVSQLDHVARNWTPGRWNADRELVVRMLASSWTGLLT